MEASSENIQALISHRDTTTLTENLNAGMPGLQELRIVKSCVRCRDGGFGLQPWKAVLQRQFEAMTKAKMTFVESDGVCKGCRFGGSRSGVEGGSTTEVDPAIRPH